MLFSFIQDLSLLIQSAGGQKSTQILISFNYQDQDGKKAERKQEENKGKVCILCHITGFGRYATVGSQFGFSFVWIFFFLSGLEYLSIQGKKEQRKYGW